LSKPKNVPVVDYATKFKTKLAEKRMQQNLKNRNALATGKEAMRDPIFVLPGHDLVVTEDPDSPRPQPKNEPEESLVGDTNETSGEPKILEAQECDTTRQNATRPLPPKHTLALEALTNGSTVTKAAEAAGVNRSTVHRWLKEFPEFREKLAISQEEIRRENKFRSHRIFAMGLDALERALKSDNLMMTKIAAMKVINMGALMKIAFSTPSTDNDKCDSGDGNNHKT